MTNEIRVGSIIRILNPEDMCIDKKFTNALGKIIIAAPVNEFVFFYPEQAKQDVYFCATSRIEKGKIVELLLS